MKLKFLKMYDSRDVPDHIMEEVKALTKDMGKAISEICMGLDSNIVLGSISYFHAIMIKDLISDDPQELEKAAKMSGIALIKNVEAIAQAKFDFFEGKDGTDENPKIPTNAKERMELHLAYKQQMKQIIMSFLRDSAEEISNLKEIDSMDDVNRIIHNWVEGKFLPAPHPEWKE